MHTRVFRQGMASAIRNRKISAALAAKGSLRQAITQTL